MQFKLRSQAPPLARFAFMAAGLVLSTQLVTAAVITYSGQDDGAGTGGPFPNSTAAEASFLAAAGSTGLITFESSSTGFYTPITPAAGVSISLSAPDYGCEYSGVCSGTYGSVYGFNTTAGGANWLGFTGGEATFNFASPVSAFGFWITGIQTTFTSTFTLSFDNGSPQTLNIPINVNGGAQFFGFVDDSGSTSAITISNLSPDAWGVDDVRYSSSQVPEPSSALLLGGGLLAVAAMMRRKRSGR